MRFSVLYHTVTGSGGPAFTQSFVITPDGILTTLKCHGPQPFGLTLPVPVDDGRTFRRNYDTHVLTIQPPQSLQAEAAPEQQSSPQQMAQHFIALSETPSWSLDSAVLSSCGWLEPVRLTTAEPEVRVFIFPARAGDRPAEDIRSSWVGDTARFSSVLNRVTSTLYVGRTSAGGYADQLDVDGDGSPELQFSAPCHFIAQLADGRIRAVEVDRQVQASVTTAAVAASSNSKKSKNRPIAAVIQVPLQPYTPHDFDDSADAKSR